MDNNTNSNKQNEKLNDKAFLRLAITSIAAILVCIVCLCSTTFAWFSDSIPNKGNQITTASKCELSVTVQNSSSEIIYLDENGSAVLPAGEYSVTLSLPKDNASCYVIISAQAPNQSYRTKYIASHTDNTAHTISFTLIVQSEKSVTFTTKWGIYSGSTDVDHQGTLTIQ